MRFLLAILLTVPVFAQDAAALASQAPAVQPAAPAKPAPADQNVAPADQTPAVAAETKAAENPVPSGEPNVTGSVYFGYRGITDIRGSLPEYRSVVDLGEGPKLFDLNFTVQDPKKRLFDRVDAWGSGWGDDPYSTAHVNARKQGIYELDFDYRNIAYFNAVPSFANAFAPAGFDWQSFDVRRHMTSFDISLFPGKHVTPYFAFDRNATSGRGIEPWTQDANNTYPLTALLSDSTNNYRGGVRFEYTRFHVTLEQGGTTYGNSDQVFNGSYQPGDRTTPSFGQTLSLNSLQQAYNINGNSIYTRALLTAHPASWLDIYGQFLYSKPRTDVTFFEGANGNFVNLASLLFYSGQTTTGTGAANQPHTTANAGFELRPFRRLRILESWSTDRFHDAASPFVTEQLLLNPTTVAATNITALTYSQYVNYNQEEVNAIFDMGLGMTLRGGYRRIWGDAQVLAGDLSQRGTVIPGELNRNVGLAGFTYRPNEKLRVNLDYEGAASDHVYFRSSLNDYHKARIQGRVQATKSLVLQASFLVLNNQNPASDIRLDFQSRSNALTILFTPEKAKWITAMAEYDRSTLRSDIAYLSLPFLSAATSSYRDNSHTATAAVDLAPPKLKGAKLTLGGSFFISAGFYAAQSRPTRYYQPMVRLMFPIVKNIYWNTEWQYYGFGEAFYLYEGFRTHIFTTGIRITR
jgi:hypothetical protein